MLTTEIVLRVSSFGPDGLIKWFRYSPKNIVDLGYAETHPDPVLTWKIKKHVDGFIKGAKLKTNSLGFRDDEFLETQQIVTIGRSVTLGEGVEFDDAWPQVLEKKLEKTGSSINKVHNFAVSAYSLPQEVRSFLLFGKDLKPKFILLPFFLEEWDVPIVPANFEYQKSPWYDFRTQMTSFFFYFAAGKLQQNLFRRWAGNDWSSLLPAKVKNASSLQAELPGMVSDLKEQTEKVVLIVLPSNEKVPPSYRSKVWSLLTEWQQRQQNVEIINVAEDWNQEYPTIFYGDPHPDGATHHRIAEKVFLGLQSKGLIQ